MDTTENRRENLRRWVAIHGTPLKEKSLFSQLKGTGSFGEKVARRLEEQYKMGPGYLDGEPEGGVSSPSDFGELPDGVHYELVTSAELALIRLYRRAGERGREQINMMADTVSRASASLAQMYQRK